MADSDDKEIYTRILSLLPFSDCVHFNIIFNFKQSRSAMDKLYFISVTCILKRNKY